MSRSSQARIASARRRHAQPNRPGVKHSAQSAGSGRPSQLSSNVDETINAVVRMLSETAHDLRSPLTTVRESVRLVSEGALGEVNNQQIECLQAAIDQCECIEQMVGEMIGLDRLRSGVPRVRRQPVSIASVREAVEVTLQPWSIPRQIQLLWDINCDENSVLFADASMLRRLVVNLVINAIRVSDEGETVLIRVAPTQNRQSIEWNVIDQGRGISISEMKQIESQRFSSIGGEGLGLSICRQLAALHFSSLRVRSRVGFGTEVRFSTPLATPSSIAESWCQWRFRQVGAEDHSQMGQTVKTASKIHRQIRLDPPLLSIKLSHQASSPRQNSILTLTTVTLGAAMARTTADEFDSLLQATLRLFDFSYRADTRKWILVLDADVSETVERLRRLEDTASDRIGAIRVGSSVPTQISLHCRTTAATICDLMVRETLTSTSASGITDANEVRLGTSPIEESGIASKRLDQELRSLSARFRGQSESLKSQSSSLVHH